MNAFATFFISITTFISGLFGNHTWVPFVSTPATPAEQILGTWKEISKKSGDATTTTVSDSILAESLGFVVSSGTPYLRKYRSSDDSKSLFSLSKWLIQQSTSTMVIQLREFYYDSDEKNEDEDTIKNTYQVSFPSKNEMVLIRLNSDGSIADPSYSIGTTETHYKRVGDRAHEENKTFTRSDEEIKKLCDRILNGNKSEIGVNGLLPLSCTIPFGKENIATTFSFSPEGSVTISQNGNTLITFSNSEDRSDTDEYAEILSMFGQNGPFINDGAIELIDVTYDGYPDLKVLTSSGAYNFTYTYYIYNPKSQTFEASSVLTDVVNPDEDFTAKTIAYFNKGRGLGDLYESGVYTFIDGKYVLTHEETQDFAPNCEDRTTCDYIHIVKSLVHGTMVVIKKEKLTLEQLGGN
jgi:hypothetical protein